MEWERESMNGSVRTFFSVFVEVDRKNFIRQMSTAKFVDTFN